MVAWSVLCLRFMTFYEADVLMGEEVKGLSEYHQLLTLYTDIYILYNWT